MPKNAGSAARSQVSSPVTRPVIRTVSEERSRPNVSRPRPLVPPKPYYEAHGITLYVGDARAILPTLPRGNHVNGVGVLLADPPYGVNARASGYRKVKLARDRIAHDETSTMGMEIVEAAWSRLRLSRHAYVFGPFDLRALPYAAGHCQLVWDKMLHGVGDLALPWGRQHEPIQFALRKDGPAQVKRGEGALVARLRAGNVLRHKRPNGKGARHHISEKPVPLLRELIEMSSRHGETVLDPCVGSGSTLVAALMEGRRAIGIELEVEWADVAVQRLEALTRYGNPFGELRALRSER